MDWRVSVGVFLVGLCGCAEGSPLVDAFSAGAGRSLDHGIGVYRLGAIKDTGFRWLPNDTGWLSLYCEASFNYWEKDNDVYGAAFSPVFIYFFGSPESAVQPYIEAGIGVAGISDTRIGDRNMSTAFQFEDRVGLGVRAEPFDFNVRYMHYSNGSVKEPNDGVDLLLFTVSYRL
jgi:lipid A 3-O-deacylase